MGPFGVNPIGTTAFMFPVLLFMSAYAPEAVTDAGVRATDPFIAKSFTMDYLARKVREVLVLGVRESGFGSMRLKAQQSPLITFP